MTSSKDAHAILFALTRSDFRRDRRACLDSVGQFDRAIGVPEQRCSHTRAVPARRPCRRLARIVGDKLGQALGQPFVIENKPGAGGNIGMEQGAKAPPDGYTLTLAPAGNLTIAPSLYTRLPYDPAKDYAPITVIATVPNVLIVHPSVPAKTLAELIALAKTKPGALNYASPGNGSGAHLAGELLKSMAGIDIVHIPFNGVGPAMAGCSAAKCNFLRTELGGVATHQVG
jgi:tripartite-type tricarboxylate transporter receptor subunit TctC